MKTMKQIIFVGIAEEQAKELQKIADNVLKNSSLKEAYEFLKTVNIELSRIRNNENVYKQ